MALINIPDIQNLDAATPELWNSRYATIVNAINGNLDDTNLAASAVTASRLATNSVITSKISNGAVTPQKWSNPYTFSVYRNAAANTGNGAYAKVVFDTEEFDTSSNFATGTYTVPVTGIYHFSWVVSVNIASGSTDTLAALYKNGAILKRGTEIEGQGGSGGSALVSATAGDMFDIYCYGSTTSALVVGAPEHTHFSGFIVNQP